MNSVELSARMQMVADMVSQGNIAADIGCDHGFVSIYLLEQKICPKVIAMDVNQGPLMRAKEHIEERGLAEYIDIRLSDGMEKLAPMEADSVLIAGMGGRLVIKILSDNMEKAKQLKEVILQPQSELHLVRQFLTENGFHIIAEDMVKDAGKYYPVIKAVWQEGKSEELAIEQLWYGPLLLSNRHSVLYEYLQNEKEKFMQIQNEIVRNGRQSLSASTEEDVIQNRQRMIDSALSYYNSQEEQG